MENASRAEAFPVGLRVLVVDDDPTWLKIIEKMLRKCSYEVTACCLARVALDLLRERREKFDIVISDVNMPDMDGFKLLEHVGFEMDLPVIMMSVDGETCRVMKGVQHGACDYLIKPIRMKELRNIWQHVYRKKIHEVREIEGHEICEEIQMFGNGSEDFDERQVSGGADLNSVRKRKDLDGKEHSDQECNDSAAVKKARVLWSVDLHQKFMNAVNQIGFDKVGPKKILDLMNVPGLTRENVASHLQKYRLYLSRLQKQNEERTYGGNLQAEFHPKGPQANFGLQNPTAASQPNAACRYVPIAQNFQAQKRTPDIHVDDVKSMVDLMFKRSKGSGEDKTSLTQIKPVFTNYKSCNSKAITPVACTIDSVSVQVERGIVNSQDFGAKHETNGLASWIPPSREPSMKNETDLISVPEDFPLCSLQNFGCFDNLGLNNVEIFQYNDSTSLTELHSNWYDGLEFNYECLNDPVEYPIIDDCLFA